MTGERFDTVVVGGGQAGLAVSEHLTELGVPHIVLEQGRIAEKWRTARWDSLVANGPAWHDRFPTLEYPGVAPDAFPSKDRVVAYFEEHAKKFNLPIRTGIEVNHVERLINRPGFRLETSRGTLEAERIVVATGPFQNPAVPPIAPRDGTITQLHSQDYKNPDALPEGSVLVVGAGSSGVQIADELQRAGRDVYLSVGPHERPPRAYRNRDFVWWLGVLGRWDAEAMEPGREHVTIAVTGARGGYTVDFRELAHQGVTLLGLTESFEIGRAYFQPDLQENIADGDKSYLEILDAADAYIERNGLDLPEEPEARVFQENPDCIANPILELDLSAANVNTIIWATGYSVDFSWLNVNALDDQGKPNHRRGVSSETDVYFVGQPWLSSRGSSFIWGVWHDARFIANHIAIRRGYATYPSTCDRSAETGCSDNLSE